MVALGNVCIGFMISCCLFPLLPMLLPNVNVVSGVIWAKAMHMLYNVI